MISGSAVAALSLAGPFLEAPCGRGPAIAASATSEPSGIAPAVDSGGTGARPWAFEEFGEQLWEVLLSGQDTAWAPVAVVAPTSPGPVFFPESAGAAPVCGLEAWISPEGFARSVPLEPAAPEEVLPQLGSGMAESSAILREAALLAGPSAGQLPELKGAPGVSAAGAAAGLTLPDAVGRVRIAMPQADENSAGDPDHSTLPADPAVRAPLDLAGSLQAAPAEPNPHPLIEPPADFDVRGPAAPPPESSSLASPVTEDSRRVQPARADSGPPPRLPGAAGSGLPQMAFAATITDRRESFEQRPDERRALERGPVGVRAAARIASGGFQPAPDASTAGEPDGAAPPAACGTPSGDGDDGGMPGAAEPRRQAGAPATNDASHSRRLAGADPEPEPGPAGTGPEAARPADVRRAEAVPLAPVFAPLSASAAAKSTPAQRGAGGRDIWQAAKAAEQARIEAPREMRLRLTADGERSVAIRLEERPGTLRVSVRTQDQGLAESLREGVTELVSRLDHRGYDTEIWRPAGVMASESGELRSREGAASSMGADWTGSGGSGSFAEQDRDRRRGDGAEGQWSEEMQAPFAGPRKKEDDDHGGSR